MNNWAQVVNCLDNINSFNIFILQKTQRRSQGKVSLGGVADLFTTPPALSPTTPMTAGTPDSVLYADLPDTPIGPGEMMVSPLSSAKSSGMKLASSGKKGRKSVGLGGKALFKRKSAETIKPKNKRVKSSSPTGIKRLMATPKSKRNTEPASPSGVAALFPTPEVKKSAKITVKPVTLKSPRDKSASASPVKITKKTVSPAKGKRKTVPIKEPVLVITPLADEPKTAKKTPLKERATRRGRKPVSPVAAKKVASPSPLKPKRGGRKRPAPEIPTTIEVEPKAKKVKAAAPVNEINLDKVQPAKKASTVKTLKTLRQTPVKARATRQGAKVATPTPKKSPSPKQVAKRGRRQEPAVPVTVEPEQKQKPKAAKKKATPKKVASPSPVKMTRGTRGRKAASPVMVLVQEIKKVKTMTPDKKAKTVTPEKIPSPSPVKTKRGTRGRPAPATPKVIKLQMSKNAKHASPAKKTKAAAVTKQAEETAVQEEQVTMSNVKKTPVSGRSTRRGIKVKSPGQVTPAKPKTPVAKRGSRKRPAPATPTMILSGPSAKRSKPATPAPVEDKISDVKQSKRSKPQALKTPKQSPAKLRATRRGMKSTPVKVKTPKKVISPSPVKTKRGTRQKSIITTPGETKPAVGAKGTVPTKAKRITKSASVEVVTNEIQTISKTTPVKSRATRRGVKVPAPKNASPSPVKGKGKKRPAPSTPSTNELQPVAKKVKAVTPAKKSKVTVIVEEKTKVKTPRHNSPKGRVTRRGVRVTSPKKQVLAEVASPVKGSKVAKGKKVAEKPVLTEEVVKAITPAKTRTKSAAGKKVVPVKSVAVEKLKSPKKSPAKGRSTRRGSPVKAASQNKTVKTVKKTVTPQKRVTRLRK